MYYQQAAEEGIGGSEADKAVADLDGGPKDVEYASIDFSLLKRKTPRTQRNNQDAIETEYAQIKKKTTEERMKTAKVEREITEGKGDEVNEDEESKQSVSEDERRVNTEMYSNMKDIINGI